MVPELRRPRRFWAETLLYRVLGSPPPTCSFNHFCDRFSVVWVLSILSLPDEYRATDGPARTADAQPGMLFSTACRASLEWTWKTAFCGAQQHLIVAHAAEHAWQAGG